MNEKFFDSISVIARGMNNETDETEAIRKGLNLLETKGQPLINCFIKKGEKIDESVRGI